MHSCEYFGDFGPSDLCSEEITDVGAGKFVCSNHMPVWLEATGQDTAPAKSKPVLPASWILQGHWRPDLPANVTTGTK